MTAKVIIRKPDEVKGVRYEDPNTAWNITKKVMIGNQEGAQKFIMRLFIVEPQGYSPKHSHAWEHEIYIVKGAGELLTEQGKSALVAGMFVFVPGGALHQFSNTSRTDNFEFICVVPNEGQ